MLPSRVEPIRDHASHVEQHALRSSRAHGASKVDAAEYHGSYTGANAAGALPGNRRSSRRPRLDVPSARPTALRARRDVRRRRPIPGKRSCGVPEGSSRGLMHDESARPPTFGADGSAAAAYAEVQATSTIAGVCMAFRRTLEGQARSGRCRAPWAFDTPQWSPEFAGPGHGGAPHMALHWRARGRLGIRRLPVCRVSCSAQHVRGTGTSRVARADPTRASASYAGESAGGLRLAPRMWGSRAGRHVDPPRRRTDRRRCVRDGRCTAIRELQRNLATRTSTRCEGRPREDGTPRADSYPLRKRWPPGARRRQKRLLRHPQPARPSLVRIRRAVDGVPTFVLVNALSCVHRMTGRAGRGVRPRKRGVRRGRLAAVATDQKPRPARPCTSCPAPRTC